MLTWFLISLLIYFLGFFPASDHFTSKQDVSGLELIAVIVLWPIAVFGNIVFYLVKKGLELK